MLFISKGSTIKEKKKHFFSASFAKTKKKSFKMIDYSVKINAKNVFLSDQNFVKNTFLNFE